MDHLTLMADWLSSSLFWLPLMAGLLIAMLSGSLGCLLVWRRLANLGDGLAHAALLGLVMATGCQINPYIGVLVVSSGLILSLTWIGRSQILPNEAVLSVLSYSCLSLGLLLGSWWPEVRLDLLSYLYGDILAITYMDVYLLAGVVVLVLVSCCWLWPWTLSQVIAPELAAVEGVPLKLAQYWLNLLLAMVIAITMKVVGVLLVTGLLVVPSLLARLLAKTPTQMAVLATISAGLSVVLGLSLAFAYNLVAGPTIVVVLAGLFGLTWVRYAWK